MMRRFLMALAALLLLPACGDTPTQFRPLPTALGNVRGVALGFTDIRQLQEGEGVYAAWITLDRGDIVFLGAFLVNSDGLPTDPQGNLIERFTADQNISNAVSILITTERNGPGAAPGSGVILQGPFFDGVAELQVPAPLLIQQSAGSYTVFTPTDGPDTNEGSGAWAIVNDEPAMQLPPLNQVYIYAQFMIINDIPVSMGRLRVSDAADLNNPHSADGPFPDVPGEDFLVDPPEGLVFPADLSGARLRVTLEPLTTDIDTPSQLVILEAILPAGLQGGEVLELINRVGDFPSGIAAIF